MKEVLANVIETGQKVIIEGFGPLPNQCYDTEGMVWRFNEIEFLRVLHCSTSQTYFNSKNEAITYAIGTTKSKGYEIERDIFLQTVITQKGETDRISVPLKMGGKDSKKWLHLQLYHMESNKYELNHYIN